MPCLQPFGEFLEETSSTGHDHNSSLGLKEWQEGSGELPNSNIIHRQCRTEHCLVEGVAFVRHTRVIHLQDHNVSNVCACVCVCQHMWCICQGVDMDGVDISALMAASKVCVCVCQ